MHNVLIVLYCETLAAIAMGYARVKLGTGIMEQGKGQCAIIDAITEINYMQLFFIH